MLVTICPLLCCIAAAAANAHGYQDTRQNEILDGEQGSLTVEQSHT